MLRFTENYITIVHPQQRPTNNHNYNMPAGIKRKIPSQDEHPNAMTVQDLNDIPPPGRVYGVLHQIAFRGHLLALQLLSQYFPCSLDWNLRTRQGETANQVAVAQEAPTAFLDLWQQLVQTQTLHELINLARDGNFAQIWPKLGPREDEAHEDVDKDEDNPIFPVEFVNTIPEGRIWGIVHRVCYWGVTVALDRLLELYPTLDLELETNELHAP